MVDEQKIKILLANNFQIFAKITIHDDGLVDVDGSGVKLNVKTERLPVQFGRVKNGFMANSCGLTSLEGSPHYNGGGFYVSYNMLTSLQGAPRYVGGDFRCGHNQLTSLKGMPETINGKISLNYHSNLGLLRVLVAREGVNFISFDKPEQKNQMNWVEETLNQFKGQGKRGVPACVVALNNLQKEWGFNLRENIKW